MKKILIITTGGTIDKSYIETKEKLENQKSQLERYLKKIRLQKKVSFYHHLALDSKDITNQHREELFNIITGKQNDFDGFIITHGTDTLVESAKYLKKRMVERRLKKPVVFTGAMRPLSVKGSDGYQNLIESLFSFEWLVDSDENVHIVMHNQIHNPDKTKKNYEKMCFELEKSIS